MFAFDFCQNGQTAHGTDRAVLCHQLLQHHPGVGPRLCTARVLPAAAGVALQQVRALCRTGWAASGLSLSFTFTV